MAVVRLFVQHLSVSSAGAEVRLDGPVSVRPNSRIFRADVDADPPFRVAVKHCLNPETGLADVTAASQQYAALKRVYVALGGCCSQSYLVARPLCHVRDLATYAMSWIDGESLTSKLRIPGVMRDGRRWFGNVGAWLGRFHSAGPVTERAVNLDERLAVVESLREVGLTHPVFGRGLDVVRRSSSALRTLNVRISWLHGDCKTDNFLLCGDDTFGIDIGLPYENAVEYDLAMWLNNFHLVLAAPAKLHVSWLQGDLEEAFWDGYRSTGPGASPEYVDWLRLSLILPFWHSTMTGSHSRIRKWLLNRIFASLSRRLIQRIEDR